MQLGMPDDSVPIRDMFERFFADESSAARVRAAEPSGHDPALWRELVALDTPFMRMAEQEGGGGMGLFDACVMMEQAGRRLASAPIAESVVAMRILGEVGGEVAREWIGKIRDGETVLTLALHRTEPGQVQLVPGAAVAAGILTFDGETLAIERPASPPASPHMLAGTAIGSFAPGGGERLVISSNADVGAIWAAGVEEWKLLTSAALIGLSREALAMAASYACERTAFSQPIGANQGIAHPLADDAIDLDGAGLLLWRTLAGLADRRPEAGAAISTLYGWASRTATRVVAHALHTFGGYGLTNEYDIQLYHRRAKAMALVLGDPEAEIVRGGRRLLLGDAASLPEPGPVGVSFDRAEDEHPLAAEARAVFERVIDDTVQLDEENFEAHSWPVHRALGEAGLLFPDWPEKWGGRGADPVATRAANGVWREIGYAGLARGVTGMAGFLVQRFGQPALQEEVLGAFGRGEKTSCLGFTEPGSGSDVFAAKTRAVRDGDGWLINGQKMFTSGAELASYVLLLTRTDPDVAKHKGLTLFLVPLASEGVEIHPVHTFMDERTNATFYADVRIPDRYRLGEVDGGVRLMAAALGMEQGGASYYHQMFSMVDAVAAWAREQRRDGAALIEDPGTLARLAKVWTHACIGEALAARALWSRLNGQPDQAYGPASKVFTTEAFIADSADLLDLAAPASLVRGKDGLGVVEKGYRHSTATSIYGGTSEVLRSMVAEKRLGLPRSRA